MTAIAAVRCANGDLVMMADSCMSEVGEACLGFEDVGTKLVTLGSTFTIGVSGSPRITQVLRHHAEPPAGGFVGEARVVRWVSDMRDLLRAHALIRMKDGVEQLDSGSLLIMTAHPEPLYWVEPGLGVIQPASHFWAIGCGRDEVRSALHAMLRGRMPRDAEHARRLLARALAASAAFNVHVQPPFIDIVRPWKPG